MKYWKKKDADLIPENIREGIDIDGIIGTMSEGVTGIDFGEVTLTSDAATVAVNHNLGVKPSFIMLIRKPVETESTSVKTIHNINGKNLGYAGTVTGYEFRDITNTLTAKKITFNSYTDAKGNNYPYIAAEYYWIAIA